MQLNDHTWQDALLQRQLIVDEHRSASKAAITKKRQIEKMKGSSSIKAERADEALDEFEDAQKHETTLAQKLQAVSERLAPSVAQHTQQMHEDLFAALLLHARTGVAHEKQRLRDLEALGPDIRAIPAKNVADVYYVHPTAPVPVNGNKTAPLSINTGAGSGAPPPLSSSASMYSPVTPTSPRSSGHRRTGSAASGRISPPPFPAIYTSPPKEQRPMYNASTMGPSSGRMDGTQSMFVPPTRANNSAATMGRVNDMAKSVYLSNNQESGRLGERVIDERSRVDARSAASKLANMF